MIGILYPNASQEAMAIIMNVPIKFIQESPLPHKSGTYFLEQHSRPCCYSQHSTVYYLSQTNALHSVL